MHGREGEEHLWSPDIGAALPQQLILPGYRDLVQISQGGSGIVYRGRQVATDHPVAVKVFTTAAQPGELEIAVGLGRAHPHIVSILDTLMTADGRPCLVMDYYELGSLHDRLRLSGPLPAHAVVSVGTIVAGALAFAHGQGVLHREIKPHNILVLPDSHVLAGFGPAGPPGPHTAPQPLEDDMPDITDDIYSLGSTLFTLLDGRPPPAAGQPPRELTTRVPTELAAIIRQCLSRQRRHRFPDALSLRAALAGVQTEEHTWAPGAGGTPRPHSEPPHPAVGVAATPSSLTPRSPAPPPPVEPPPVEPPPVEPPPVEPPPVEPPRPVIPFVAPPPVETPRPAGPVTASPAAGPPLIEPPLLPVIVPARLEPLMRPVMDDDRLTVPLAPVPVREKPRSRRPNLAILAGIALLAGGLIGVGAAWIRSAGTPTTAQPTPLAGAPVPSFSGTVPTPGGSPRANEAAIAPTITTFLDKGTSFELTWTDKSNGKAVFVVIEISGANGVPLTQTAAGQTTVVIGGIDPKRPYCLAVLAVTDTGQALSPLRCTGTRGTP